MADIQIYEVVHTSPELKTVYDYISEVNSPAFAYTSDPESFLLVKNSKGQANREVIESTYTSKAEQDKYKGKSSKQLLLKIGTKLAIEQKKVNKAGLMTEGIEIVSYDIPAFKAQALANLESKEGYAVQDYAKPIKGKLQKGSFRMMYPDVTVWVWCRTLANASNNFEGEIFNLTPFIEKVETDVGKNGGNFQISLPPLTCEMNEQGQWVVKKKTLQFYQSKNLSLQNDDYVAEAALYEEKDNELRRNDFLFHTLLSTNDVIWIRFETLKLEQDQRIDDAGKLRISKQRLPDRIYDMIGLIDVDTITFTPGSGDVNIQIGGRDLSKLFIEDGTYVFNLELTQGMLGSAGSSRQDGLSKRLVVDKSLLYLSLYFNNSIEKVIKFVINQLSNIKVVPDVLFEPYGDRRNTRFEEKKDDQDSKQKTSKEIQKLKQEGLTAIRNLRKSNGSALVDNPGGEDKKVAEIFNEMYRFLKEIRNKKVRVTEGSITSNWLPFKYTNIRGAIEDIKEGVYPNYFSTDLFNLLETRLVPETLPIVTPIDKIIDLIFSKPNHTGELEKDFAPGIWQIIKLVLDKQVTGRRVIDSSLSSANGSLLNYFRKICQEPFVEFFMDTYNDMYHIIVRKPPTDKAGVLSMLQAQVKTEDSDKDGTERVTPAVIDIEADDVLMEQLYFDDTEAISWYHLVPQANFQGGDQFSLAYLPAIFLPEYADIWGSRPMQLVHNYLPVVLKDSDKDSLDKVQRQAVEDLKYIIESNAYLPFTRKGIIKTNGDRRYKVGNIIRYKPTGEIFFVDHVKQEWSISETSIDRVSTIQVSRGMIEQLVYGIPAKSTSGDTVDSFISYFNIVETKPKYDYKDVTAFKEEKIKVGQRVVSNGSAATQEPNLEYPLELITGKGNENIHKLNDFPDKEKNKFTKFIYETNKLGYSVSITSGVRTYAEQDALHRQNSNNAKPGHSKHETKLAIDINLTSITTGKVYKKDSSNADWLSTGVPQLGYSMNMKWGGQDFGSYHDPIHFQLNQASSSEPVMEDVYETRRTPVKQSQLDTAKLFENFKVNKHVFEFFLRKEQLNYKTVNDRGVYDDKGVKQLEEVIIKNTKK
jgi:hypothetical protein